MGVAELDNDHLLLTIHAHIILYGDAADEMLARQVAEEIEGHWNLCEPRVLMQGAQYKLIFRITSVYDPSLKPLDIYENDNPLNNYFRVEEFSESHISFVDGIGSNTGYFKLDNLLNNSTTAAHEFGHTLGLLHPDHLDIRGMGTPGMMYPRGTIVDPHFQYDPNATPATTGGTMNPFHRKVLQTDINNLKLDKLSFDKNGRAIVGEFSSVWHHKHLPH
jgi:hypothetical protein